MNLTGRNGLGERGGWCLGSGRGRALGKGEYRVHVNTIETKVELYESSRYVSLRCLIIIIIPIFFGGGGGRGRCYKSDVDNEVQFYQELFASSLDIIPLTLANYLSHI